MRRTRLLFVLLAFYFVFVGGSSYFYQVYPLRYLHHALVTVLLVGWLANRIRNGGGLPETPINWPLFGLAGVWFVSGLLGMDWRMSLEHIWMLLVHMLIFFVLVDLMRRGQQRLVMETQFLIGALVIFISGLQLLSWYFGLGITPDTQVGWAQVIGPDALLPLRLPRLWLAMGVSTWLAAYTVPLAVVAAGWAFTVRQRDYRRVLWILAGGFLATTLLTLSRGGILALAASVTVWMLLRVTARLQFSRLFERRNLPLLGVLGLIAVGALAAILMIGSNPGRIAGDALRLNLWNSAGAMIADHPLLGVGTGMFGRAVRTYRDPMVVDERLSTAHNILLNSTAEIGVIGLVFALVAAVILLRTWLHNWQRAEIPENRLRQEAVYAALIGFAAQSMVDNFMLTSVVSVFLVLLAYSLAGQGLLPAATPPSRFVNRIAAVVSILVVSGYGVWLVTVDWADFNFRRSLSARGDAALEYAQAAEAIDPGLHLYDLQVAYLTAAQSDDPQTAISAYESALQLEPTWTTGWLNLAALAEANDDLETARNALEQAAAVNYANAGWLHWARLSEENDLATSDAIIEAYMTVLALQDNVLPLSPFWGETPLRQQAVENYRQTLPLDWQYRIAVVHNPDLLLTLVPDSPQTAAEWWVAGEYALTVNNDRARAITNFTEAIARDRLNGDFYVARARAELESDPAAAQRDLDLARLLGTRYEYPNAVQIQLAQSPEEVYQLRVEAVPPQVIDQNFEGVLFSRPADFIVAPALRMPGPGTAVMQPWYDIAESYEAAGDFEGAVRVYRVILDYAPYERQAAQELERLTN